MRSILSKAEPTKLSELKPNGAPTREDYDPSTLGGYDLLLLQLPASHGATKQA